MRIGFGKDNVTLCRIGCCNWSEQYPAAPDVTVAVSHDGDMLYLHFEVDEPFTLGAVRNDNGETWTDSCVEFFVAPDDSGNYYNFEFTCTGKLLIEYGRRRDREVAPAEVLKSVERIPSLGYEPVGLLEGVKWSLDAAIPASALFAHDIKSWSGQTLFGNFFKCGNNLPERHYLSWAPVDTPEPDFHRPEFFVPISFDYE